MDSVANLTKKRTKAIHKNKKHEEKRAEKALSILDKQDTRIEKEIGRNTVKQKIKNLWD